MNPTARYLEHNARTTADTVTGEILERLPNGTYKYRDIAADAIRYATPNQGDEFAIGSRVRIDRPSASRSTIGSQDVIVTRAPREQRGLSASSATEERVGVDRAGISEVVPDPLVLVAGGDQEEQIIKGHGLSGAPTYTAAVGTAPTIAQLFDPEVGDDGAITTFPKASGLSALGDFDLRISGERAPKAVRVVAPNPTSILFIPGARVYGVWPEKGTLIRQSVVLPTMTVRTFAVDSLGLIVAFYSGGGAAVLVPSLRSYLDFASPLFPLPNATTQLVDDMHGCIWYGTATGLAKVDVSTGAATIVHNNGGTYEGVAYDAAHDVIFACEQSTRNVRRFIRETGALTNTVLMPTLGSPFLAQYPRNLLVYSGSLYCWCVNFAESGGGVTVVNLDTTSLAQTGTSSNAATGAFPIGLTEVLDGVPTWIVRDVNTGTGGYDASTLTRVRSVAGLALLITPREGLSARAFEKLMIAGRTSDSSRLQIAFVDKLSNGTITTTALITCEAAVPATPVPSSFMRA